MTEGSLRTDKPFDAVQIAIMHREPGGEWQDAVMFANSTLGGFVLESAQQGAFPVIQGAVIEFQSGAFYPIGAGDIVTVEAPDLINQEVFIAARRPDPGERDPENEWEGWEGIYWGVVNYQLDNVAPAASLTPQGLRKYFCVDIASQFQYKQLNHHGYAGYDPGSVTPDITLFNISNNPGYNSATNASLGASGISSIAGNKDKAGNSYDNNGAIVELHTQSDGENSLFWTDLDAIDHAISSTMGPEKREWAFVDHTGSLEDSISVWEVNDGEPVWNLINRILDRKRGRGQAVFEWIDDEREDVSEGQLPIEPTSPSIAIYPATEEDITYIKPADGSTGTIIGAVEAETTRAFSLINFPLAPDMFEYNTRGTNQVDFLETYSEPIEIVGTVSYEDGILINGWRADNQVDWEGATDEAKKLERYRDVFQSHEIPPSWDGTIGAALSSIADTSTIGWGTSGENAQFLEIPINPTMVKILPNLPLYSDIDYSLSPPKKYGDSSDAVKLRRQMTVKFLINSGSSALDDEWTELPTIGVNGFLENGSILHYEQHNGQRIIGDISNEGTLHSTDNLAFTLNFQLPNKLSCTTGDPNGNRRIRFYVPGQKLELVDALAIWSIDSNGKAVRNCEGTAFLGPNNDFAVMRDDRDTLTRLHSTLVHWFVDRRDNVDFTIKRDCALLRTYPSAGAENTVELIEYPRAGELLTSLEANAQTYEPRTPITQVTYNHQGGGTTFSTDWVDLDFS